MVGHILMLGQSAKAGILPRAPIHLPPIAINLLRVRKNNVPYAMAGVAMQMSPRSFVAAVENSSLTGAQFASEHFGRSRRSIGRAAAGSCLYRRRVVRETVASRRRGWQGSARRRWRP